jgi:hypothetical protein
MTETDDIDRVVTTHCIVCDGRFTANRWDRTDDDRWRCDECKRTGRQLRWKLAGVESAEFAAQPFERRLFDLAVAYLESAKVLCVTLGEAPNETTWPRASVVYFTSYHATELFLKACIICGAPATKKFDHDIERLQNRFAELFPTIEPLRTDWDMSVDTITGVFGLTWDAVLLEDFEHKHDQVYRYGADMSGRTMRTDHAFAPAKWIQWIEYAEVDFARIWTAITTVPSTTNQ